MTLSSMSPVRNPQPPLSTPLINPSPSWHTSNWDINTKFSGHLPLGKKNIIHDVRNDQVLHVSGQEPSMSSKYPPSCPPLPDTLPINISIHFFQGIFLGMKKTLFKTSGMTLSSMSPVRNPQCPPSTPITIQPKYYTQLQCPWFPQSLLNSYLFTECLGTPK